MKQTQMFLTEFNDEIVPGKLYAILGAYVGESPDEIQQFAAPVVVNRSAGAPETLYAVRKSISEVNAWIRETA